MEDLRTQGERFSEPRTSQTQQQVAQSRCVVYSLFGQKRTGLEQEAREP